MTPQLQQAIKLLQLSNIELTEYIEEELAQNPLLEKVDGPTEDGTNDAGQESTAQEPKEEPKDQIQAEFDEGWSGGEDNARKDAQTDFDPGSAQMGAGGSRNFDVMDESFESRMSEEKTLRQHLMAQLEVAFDQSADKIIAALLIDQLDESGYLPGDHAHIAEQLGCKPERMEKILDTMKGFDPTGVFAGGLAECLSLQLDEKKALDAPMKKLLENLRLLANHDHKKLCEICGVNDTYLKDMIAEIRALNPKPAFNFDHSVTQTAIPDVLMKKLPSHLGGGWRVELNSDTLPRVLVNQKYYTEVSQRATQKKDKEYLSNQLNSANWLVRSLDQRAQTILKTAAALVEEQDAFFNYGIEFLKPLTLKDIADIIQMHESTVSRVTTNKYIGTPRGIFELKFFFSTAIGGQDGGATHSSESVKARIKILIDAEDPKKILSDDALVDILKSEGIDIARRTVAKYREGMNIDSSVQRRRRKKNLLNP